MNPRIFSENKIDASCVEISGSEHLHMAKVLRLQTGSCVVLFDGSGVEFDATILQVNRNGTQLSIDSRCEVNRELTYRLTLGVALPKGDRQQWLIEKCVELGVTRLTPLLTMRGVAQPRDKALQRLQRWIIAASKQCRRNSLMQVTEPKAVDHFVAEADPRYLLFAHPDPDARPLVDVVDSIQGQHDVSVAVGPEGGFANDEVSAAKVADCQLVSLGDRILRIETAALAIVANLALRDQP